jgi:hypothetical protein
MIFSHEEVGQIPLVHQQKSKPLLSSNLIPLLRLVSNEITLHKPRILLELQELNKLCLVFEASKEACLNSNRFIDLMSEREFSQRLGNILYPNVFKIDVVVNNCIQVFVSRNTLQIPFLRRPDPSCICSHRSKYEEGACEVCGGYVEFCWECGASSG